MPQTRSLEKQISQSHNILAPRRKTVIHSKYQNFGGKSSHWSLKSHHQPDRTVHHTITELTNRTVILTQYLSYPKKKWFQLMTVTAICCIPLQYYCHSSAYYKKGSFPTTETNTSEQLCWETEENSGYPKKPSPWNCALIQHSYSSFLCPYYCFKHLDRSFRIDSSAAIVTSFEVKDDYELILYAICSRKKRTRRAYFWFHNRFVHFWKTWSPEFFVTKAFSEFTFNAPTAGEAPKH